MPGGWIKERLGLLGLGLGKDPRSRMMLTKAWPASLGLTPNGWK